MSSAQQPQQCKKQLMIDLASCSMKLRITIEDQCCRRNRRSQDREGGFNTRIPLMSSQSEAQPRERWILVLLIMATFLVVSISGCRVVVRYNTYADVIIPYLQQNPESKKVHSFGQQEPLGFMHYEIMNNNPFDSATLAFHWLQRLVDYWMYSTNAWTKRT